MYSSHLSLLHPATFSPFTGPTPQTITNSDKVSPSITEGPMQTFSAFSVPTITSSVTVIDTTLNETPSPPVSTQGLQQTPNQLPTSSTVETTNSELPSLDVSGSDNTSGLVSGVVITVAAVLVITVLLIVVIAFTLKTRSGKKKGGFSVVQRFSNSGYSLMGQFIYYYHDQRSINHLQFPIADDDIETSYRSIVTYPEPTVSRSVDHISVTHDPTSERIYAELSGRELNSTLNGHALYHDIGPDASSLSDLPQQPGNGTGVLVDHIYQYIEPEQTELTGLTGLTGSSESNNTCEDPNVGVSLCHDCYCHQCLCAWYHMLYALIRMLNILK